MQNLQDIETALSSIEDEIEALRVKHGFTAISYIVAGEVGGGESFVTSGHCQGDGPSLEQGMADAWNMLRSQSEEYCDQLATEAELERL